MSCMKKILLVLTFTLLLFHSSTLISHSDQTDDLNKQIIDLQKKIDASHDQIKTLSGQITYYDNQIILTTLKISQTEAQINSITEKISQLEITLRSRADLLEEQIVQIYKKGPVDSLQILFSNLDVSKIISRFKYMQFVQATNREILHDTQMVQTNYAQQKTLVQESKKKLDAQKKNLASIRAERDNLLKQTKNNEVLYQHQLEQAKLELEAIERGLANAVAEGPIKAGDVIGLMGNSGYPYCSTGDHLHFEVRKNDVWINAETYLKNTTDKWGLNIGSGNWDWPMRGVLEITQRYGNTPYSYRYKYSGGVHTGIDMVSSDKTIRAVADGTLYASSEKCGSATIKLKYIDHGNGLKTLYLHIQ